MVDSLAFPAAAPFVTPTAPAATAAPVVEFASPPPPSLLAAGGVIAATVVGRDGEGVLVLRTDFGNIALKTLLALDPGTSVELKLFTGPPAGAAILSADGAPLGYGALRAAATPGSAAAPAILQTEAAPLVVQLGQTVRATVVGPAATPGAPAAGSELMLRIALGALPSSPATLTATVVQSGGPTTLVDSALGRLALQAQIDLAAGSTLTLERLAAPARAGATAAAPTSPTLGSGWPALDDALATLERTAPDLATQLRADLTPSNAPRLAAALLFFMGVLKGDTNWPGDPTSLALTGAGRADLRARLAKDVSDLRQQATGSAQGDWRIFTLPVLDEAAVRPIRLYVRNQGDQTKSGGQSQQGSRFVLDLDLTRLGPLQLDGLVRGPRFDLVLRSHEPLDPKMKTEIGTLFRSALEGSGLAGDVNFVNTTPFPISPLSALRPRLGLQI
jgi:hypothetical protein